MESSTAFNKLLVSVAGILIFISLAFMVDINGLNGFSPLLILIGVLVLIFSEQISASVKNKFITKHIVNTIAQVLIFLGLKVYLDLYVEKYWFIYFVVGVVLLNNSKLIARKMANLF